MYRWHAILETADFYQTAEINTWTGAIESDRQRDVIYKPADTPAVEAAKQTRLGKVYLDWGRWAVVRDLGQEPVDGRAAAGFAARADVDDGRVLRSAVCLLVYGFARAMRGGRRWVAGFISWTGAKRRPRGWANRQQK